MKIIAFVITSLLLSAAAYAQTTITVVDTRPNGVVATNVISLTRARADLLRQATGVTIAQFYRDAQRETIKAYQREQAEAQAEAARQAARVQLQQTLEAIEASNVE